MTEICIHRSALAKSALYLVCLGTVLLAGSCKKETPADTNARAEPMSAAAAPSGAVAAAKYTCPMHPEVTSDRPGRCPQCKMDLVVQQNPPPRTQP